MFWLENIVFLLLFIVVEIVLSPFVYIKNIANVIYSSYGLFTTIFYTIIWIFFGVGYILFMAFYDLYSLFNILTMLEGCRKHFDLDNDLDEEEEDLDMIVRCYNDAREVAIQHY